MEENMNNYSEQIVRSDEEILGELKEWVIKNYNKRKCGWTSERSYGNCDDCFEDGCESGTSWAAYEIGQILGMELAEPDQPDYE